MYYIRFRFTAIVVIPLAGRFDILSGYYMFLNWDLFFSHCQVQNINYLSLLINISLPFVSKCVLVFFFIQKPEAYLCTKKVFWLVNRIIYNLVLFICNV